MKIAVIGAGNVGSALARAASAAGNSVVVSAIDTSHAEAAAKPAGGAVATSNAQAARDADLIVLAVPYGAVDKVVKEIAGATAGKIVIDATNPLKPDGSGLAVTDRSGAELVQDRLPSASVVKAFNTVFAT